MNEDGKGKLISKLEELAKTYLPNTVKQQLSINDLVALYRKKPKHKKHLITNLKIIANESVFQLQGLPAISSTLYDAIMLVVVDYNQESSLVDGQELGAPAFYFKDLQPCLGIPVYLAGQARKKEGLRQLAEIIAAELMKGS